MDFLHDELFWDPWPEVERNMDLKAALETLTDKQRVALELYLAGYTQEEIGERLGVSKPAVCRRLQRAYDRLREFLS